MFRLFEERKPVIDLEEKKRWLEHESKFRSKMLELELRQIKLDSKLSRMAKNTK